MALHVDFPSRRETERPLEVAPDLPSFEVTVPGLPARAADAAGTILGYPV
ncbi:MAG: hypothetical protein JST53_03260 [Actinobacteria bacterium]|nr:hypothetical protein [Actinomycetota bacterium]